MAERPPADRFPGLPEDLERTDAPPGPERLAELRALLDEAFPDGFDDSDLDHALGGTHLFLRVEGLLVAHAAVVPRRLHVGARVLRCGYVEAVATRPSHQGQGRGTRVMEAVGVVLRERYEVGALSTGEAAFYERLGWRRWEGPAYVVDQGTWTRTPDEDDAVMVLELGRALDRTERIAVDRRAGDSW